MTTSVRPKVYTISPERPFLATLADGLLAMTRGDPLLLPSVRVLLPTRRAVRALREAFLRATSEEQEVRTPLLLPRMRALGDLDSVLADHAHCEMKAASNAMSLAARAHQNRFDSK